MAIFHISSFLGSNVLRQSIFTSRKDLPKPSPILSTFQKVVSVKDGIWKKNPVMQVESKSFFRFVFIRGCVRMEVTPPTDFTPMCGFQPVAV